MLDINIFFTSIVIIFISTGVMLLAFFQYKYQQKKDLQAKFRYFHDLENEKKEISRELHDSISEFTMPLKSYFNDNHFLDSNAKKYWIGLIYNYEEYLTKINETIFPSSLTEGSFYFALKNLAQSLSTQNLHISVYMEDEFTMSKENSIHAFRIIQECLHNILKYREVDFVIIVLNQESTVHRVRLLYTGHKAKHTDSLNKNSRGQLILVERLKILNGSRRISYQENWITEEFEFKDLQNEYTAC